MPLATAGQWVRADWAYQPIALSHTGSTIVKALHSALTQSGWEYAPWSGTGDDRYYLRSDRRFLNVTNDANGTGGNVTMTKVGANINVTGMSGGTVSTKATGYIELVAQPADGNTVTISDGTTSVTFEFDNNAAVTGGNVLVTIGTMMINTVDNLLAAINANGFNVTASIVSDQWRYNGDVVEQNCGLHVFWNTGSARVEISAFLENTAGGAAQVDTTSTQRCFIAYNNTLQNDWLIYCGEDGVYYETGVSGTPQNIAHGLIATFMPIPEFSGTKDAQRKWTTQGLSMDLFGNIKFTTDRNIRFIDNAGANKNYTGSLQPFVARGVVDLATPVRANDRRHPVGPADNWIGGSGIGISDSERYWFCALGMAWTPIDDRYKISPMWMLQHLTSLGTYQSSGVGSNNVAPASVNSGVMIESRWLRKLPRIAVPDSSLLPYVNVTDPITSKIYRIARVADGGRNASIAIEYPATAVTIPTTPTV